MLKWLGCTAVAALFAIVQIAPGIAQSAAPTEKPATDAAADKPVVEKPAAERSTTDKEAVRSPTRPVASRSPADKAAASDGDRPKKKAKKLTRQQELDRSVETGTVPARYRSQVPKQYHQFIPFARQ